MISKLITVELREVWKNEAKDFTTWLGNNLDYLKEQLGIELTLVEIEKSVGSFYVDVLAQDDSGHLAIIENQLGKTDHDHLGKVLTYLTNLEAKTAIWISPDPRPEHVSVINYLNQISPEDIRFYLIKVSAFKIDSSLPAPLFTIIAGPGNELRDIGKIKNDLSDKDKKRFEFFSQLLNYSNSKTNLFSNVSPVGYQNWVTAGAGKSGLYWVYSVWLNKSNVHLYFGSSDAQKNKERFDKLLNNKTVIENEFGNSLEWDYKEGRQQHYIKTISNGGLNNEANWETIQKDMVVRMIKLEKVLGKYLKEIE
ncbi:MAG: DUF4268 domain-containing protein [Ignavibacteriales bacterium]|nr:DUF4268 domain-containing protein [Ignavibacteriales bacterium]